MAARQPHLFVFAAFQGVLFVGVYCILSLLVGRLQGEPVELGAVLTDGAVTGVIFAALTTLWEARRRRRRRLA